MECEGFFFAPSLNWDSRRGKTEREGELGNAAGRDRLRAEEVRYEGGIIFFLFCFV